MSDHHASAVNGCRIRLESEAAQLQASRPVLNGAIVAAFGVYDYWEPTGDAAVRDYLERAVAVIAGDVHLFRTRGGVQHL